jgi:nucleotide-binding universal stress UspA family protein
MARMKLNTIVVGFDDTDPARRALERAADLAEAFGAKLVVTSVAPTEHRKELQDAKELLEARSIEVEYVPAIGEPADTIAELADDRNADLIVVGSRDPGILERLLGQSVSERVAHHAHRDVLIVH